MDVKDTESTTAQNSRIIQQTDDSNVACVGKRAITGEHVQHPDQMNQGTKSQGITVAENAG